MLGINAIHITPEVLRQVSSIDEFKGLWTGLDKHTTGLHLLGDVADYGAKFEAVLKPLKDQPITSDIVRILHANQMGEKGQSDFRHVDLDLALPNSKSPTGHIHTAISEDIEPLLAKLCGWVNESLDRGTLHPLLVAAVFMSVFLQIAPFQAGNIRVVRFLLILILLKAGYTYAPYVSLASIMDERGDAFYAALYANQNSLEAGQPDWSQWLAFFLNSLEVQTCTLYERLYGKETELQNLPALSAKIMVLFKEHKRLQMKQIIKLTRGRRATIKLRLSELLEAGYLRRYGQGRGTWYSLV
ncbi:MAG: Fic family protein [Bdellovibrionales bacterium]